MDDSDNMSTDDNKSFDSISTVKTKPKKRSLVERELETNLTARVTSPVTNADNASMSRYGRARRLKTQMDPKDSKKLESPKLMVTEKSPIRVQSPVYKMHASNTPIKMESPKKPAELNLENQIENIYQENISLCRFASEELVTTSPFKKLPKVYIQKDLIQRKDTDDPVMLIKNIFSPEKSSNKLNSHLNTILERSEMYNMNISNKNGYSLENSSVVKTLDFDSKKKKKENKDKVPPKNVLFELEAKCMYQVGDLAWARMGTYPFWPCIITRDPDSGMFVKKKLFGRVEHDIIHVTFFGDNGRRSWIVDNMLRNYTGLAEFESTREQFTVEDKKRDPRLYAAFFISEKKQALWKTSVDEAETLVKEPKRLRIDLFNDMLEKCRDGKTTPKLQKKVTRTDSDVSLSESLYDSLFSEDDGKIDDTERSRNKSRNKSLDVSEVVTACLDNMAAKTGITKIQKQSHMDRWLQKAKSQTPEKIQVKTQVVKVIKMNNNRKWKILPKEMVKPYSLRRSGNESLTLLFNQNEHDYSKVLPDIFKVETKQDVSKIETVSNLNINNDKTDQKSVNFSGDENSFKKTIILEKETKSKANLNEIDKAAVEDASLIVETNKNVMQNNALTDDTKDIDSSKELNIEACSELLRDSANSFSVNNIETKYSTNLYAFGTHSTAKTITDVENQMKVDSVNTDSEKDENDSINKTQTYFEASEIKQTSKIFTVEKTDKDNVESIENLPCDQSKLNEDIGIDTKIKRMSIDLRESGSHSMDKESFAYDHEMEADPICNMPFKKNGTDIQNIEINLKREMTNVTNETSLNYIRKEGFDDDGHKVKVKAIDDEHLNDVKAFTEHNDSSNNKNKEICEYMLEDESRLVANDNVDDFNNMAETTATLQDISSATNTAKTCMNLDTPDNQSSLKIVSDETIHKIDVEYATTLTDTTITNTVTDEPDAIHSFMEKLESNSKTEIVASSDTELSSSNDNAIIRDTVDLCRTDSLRSNDKHRTNNAEIEMLNTVKDIETIKLNSPHEQVIHCNIKETTSQDKHNDSSDIRFEENKEAKVGTCNLYVDKNSKITEDNFLNNKSKADNFIFLDKSTGKSIDLSKNMNGTLDDVNFMENYNIDTRKCDTTAINDISNSLDITDSYKHSSTNLVNGDHEIKNGIVSENEEDNNSVMSIEDNCKTERITMIEFVSSKAQETHIIKPEKKPVFGSESNYITKESNEFKENIVKVVSDMENIQNSYENNTLGPKENGNNLLSYYSLNSPVTRENNLERDTIPILDISSINDSLNESAGTRSFLDNLNSLELAICNDIAKLDVPVKESEKLIPTLSSPKIDSEPFEDYVNEMNSINKCSLTSKQNKYKDINYKTIDNFENKSEVPSQNDNFEENSKTLENNTQVSNINDTDFKNKKPELQSDVSAIIVSKSEDKVYENELTVNEIEETKLAEPESQNICYVKDDKGFEKPTDGIETNEQKFIKTVNETESYITNITNSEINVPEICNGSVKDTAEVINDVEMKKASTEPKIHNKILENVKECHYTANSYHDSDSLDIKDSDDDFDIDAISVNSEDSIVSLNKTDKYYKRKLRAKADRPLEDPDFLIYLEMRQDSLIDEHPGLTDDEIIAYLYKTYLYEESQKSDMRKTDDIEQSSIVKGLNERNNKKNRVSRSVRDNLLHKKRNRYFQKDFIEDSDTASLTSDSDVFCNNKVVNESELIVMMSDKVNCKGDRLMKITKVNKGVINGASDTSKIFEAKQTVLTEHIDKTKRSDEFQSKVVDLESKSEDVIKEIKHEFDCETASIASEEMDVPLLFRKMRTKVKENDYHKKDSPITIRNEAENVSVDPENSEVKSAKKTKVKNEKKDAKYMQNPEFAQYLELRQDALIDENPQLTHEEIVHYLYKTWLYEEDKKSEHKKNDEIEQSGLVKGLKPVADKRAKIKKKLTVDKEDDSDDIPRLKRRRKASKPFYNEEYTDLEDELEIFEIFKNKSFRVGTLDENSVKTGDTVKTETEPFKSESETVIVNENEVWEDEIDEVKLYFKQLTQSKPNIFKGLIREKVCEICENVNNLIKCKSCHGMFHIECIRKADEVVKVNNTPPRGRKKKKPRRKPKSLEDSESQSDEKCLNISEEQNLSIEENIPEPHTVDADVFEQLLSTKMKEVLDNLEAINYDSYSSDDCIDWVDTVPGKCEIVDIKLKRRQKPIDYSDFKCNNCQKYDTPVCFVCKSATSKTGNEFRQKCNVAHCLKYYHLECLDHWPQTHFNAGEPSKSNKKINEHFEALTCPRHVCHTCVSDDPRGCKTRFSGDKLARCVRCPATYHSFTKCVPAGTKILTGSHVICPRHHEHRPGKVPCHVNTGWCFICALGGTLICCEYCPTSFHAECLNIDPPEGGYMCEDCETGRLPLYGEMVWVKLGNYRWWPGIILHPCEIPENLLSVRHSLGEFVVRFFGQYDHYWVNRGRVFPFQEGDSGRVSGQKSKIDAAFTTAMEHAQRACEILKSAEPNEEESMDIASSLLPPHYVKLKTNKPIGSVCMKKVDDPELSLTQCECDPNEEDPCGPYSQCLNRMLLTECGPTCRAGDRCNNRAFEKRLYPKLTPYRTHHRGWGLKTLEDIKAGQFVIEYVGELIDEEEFKRRMRRKHEIRDENYYFLTLDKERMIDAGPKGNLARFMNHCCEPNCETQKWTVLGDVRVGLFALHDIPANSEVTFNYNLECAGIEKKRCLCGTKRCSGYMGAKPKQDESQQKKNKPQAKRTYKKRKIELSPTPFKNKKRLGRPPKNKELTEIEKDLLIIRSATNLSSDDSDFQDKPKTLKRKRISFSSEEVVLHNGEASSSKIIKMDVGD